MRALQEKERKDSEKRGKEKSGKKLPVEGSPVKLPNEVLMIWSPHDKTKKTQMQTKKTQTQTPVNMETKSTRKLTAVMDVLRVEKANKEETSV